MPTDPCTSARIDELNNLLIQIEAGALHPATLTSHLYSRLEQL